MLQINESYVNQTKGHRFGESGWYEPLTDDRAKLFRSLQREFGRCASRVYQDTPDGKPDAIGWVFEKRMRYDDARGNNADRDFYIREVWVTLRLVKDEE